MPGLSGLFDRTGWIGDSAEASLTAMLQSQQHHLWLKVQRQTQGPFSAGRVHLGTLPTGEQPARDEAGRFVLWLDGEIYNRDELASANGLDHISGDGDARFLLELYLLRHGWDFLPQLDGIFAIAMFDTIGKQLTLVSDRLGLRPLYYWASSDVFAFASEVKSIAELPGRPKKLDRLGMEEFLAYGWMLNDRTWFEDIRVLGLSTILTVTETGMSQATYWSWTEVQPLPAGVSFEQAAEEMARLWEMAVARRVRTNHRYGLQLSGGLDSRSILAALPPGRLPAACVTMGVAGSDDIKIASRVAQIRGCLHIVVELDKINDFLVKREPFVWLTDGMISTLHLHASAMANALRDTADFSLNGFVGEVILGGAAINTDLSPQKNLAKSYADQRSLTGFDGYAHILQEWQKADMPLEWFAIYQRARRFTVMGAVQLSAHIEERRPFVDRDLLLFGMGVPAAYRNHRQLYGSMLLTHYPDLYRGVPWQKTGVPIDAGAFWKRLAVEGRRLRGRLTKTLPFLGGHLLPFRTVDYAVLLRKPETQSYVTRRLLSDDSRVREFVPENEIRRVCETHFRMQADMHHVIGRLLTAETYLARSGHYVL